MTAATQTTETRSLSIVQRTGALLRHSLGDRKVEVLLAFAVVGLGLAFNWSWLVAAGIAPILVAFAPCAAMCVLGLCMNKMGGKSCSNGKSNDSTSGQVDGSIQKGFQ